MTMQEKKSVRKVTIEFANGEVRTVDVPEEAVGIYRSSTNGTKLGDKPAKRWVEHQITWTSDRRDGVG